MASNRWSKNVLPKTKPQTPIQPNAVRCILYSTLLIPALSEQVLRQMDVNSITQELQAHSRARQAGTSLSASFASNIELLNAPRGRERSQDTRSELSDTSFSGSASTQSWVETGGSSGMILRESVAPVHPSDSLMTTTSTDTSNISVQGIRHFQACWILLLYFCVSPS
ncbi:hypothetical protein R3P38DRAFT_989930 [Favolaschia claudopus]|uniref:Uncharacterized protein n=1 Tax=Favolaschia claudopus TaxID=2862362 RepID=A0AAW0BLE4_9AGAR